MRFAHISDLHLCCDPAHNPSVNDDAVIVVERLARDLRKIKESLDFVILSGDLTDDATPESFELFEQIFADLGLPLFLVPGNHDGPAAFNAHKTISPMLAQCDISGRVVEMGSLRILGINTCIEGATTGTVPSESLELLASALQSAVNSQLLVVMHHPPFMPGQREFDDISALEGSDRFTALLHDAVQAPIVLCGHVHRPYFGVLEGANCFIAGSPARPFSATPPFGNIAIQPSGEPFSYFVHWIEHAGHHVMTSRWIEP